MPVTTLFSSASRLYSGLDGILFTTTVGGLFHRLFQLLCRSTFNNESRDMKVVDERQDLEEQLKQYAAKIVALAEELPQSGVAIQISSQLLRSGISPMVQYGRAQAAKSGGGAFVHNLKIGLKGLRESLGWLRLAQTTPSIERPDLVALLVRETNELIRLFTASIQAAKSKLRGAKKK
jgi:four helix bundle protein